MGEQMTCGKGLAEQSPMPAKLADLIAALAANLELHLPSLDLGDPHSRAEHAAYVELAQSYRQIAAQLQATAARMAGYRDLAMGRHDEAALSDPRIAAAFADFVRIKRELRDLLQAMLGPEEAMLAQMQ